MITHALLGLLLASSEAQAAKCDALLAKARASNGAAVAAAFKDLASCDPELAGESFKDLLKNATDSDALHDLSLVAVKANIWQPVWKMPGYITDYDVRDEVVRRIGSECATDESVVTFLQAAYSGLKDIEFQRWQKALEGCDAPALNLWMVKTAATPPQKVYDEKYNTLLGIYVKRARSEALASLQTAAIAAAEAGPFDMILAQMNEAVAAPMGGEMAAADKEKLEGALIEVARAVKPEQAKLVADRLANSGSQRAAARLLPSIYPNRVQAGGAFLYGAVSVEAGECKGEKQAVLHFAEVTEPGKRWVILGDLEGPMRAYKPKLKDCTVESPWSVATTPEPVKGGDGIEAWLAELEKQWAGQGYSVKVQSEKPIKLP